MVKNLCCARGVIKVVNQLKTCEHLGVHWHKDDPKAKTHGLQAKKVDLLTKKLLYVENLFCLEQILNTAVNTCLLLLEWKDDFNTTLIT